MEVVVMGGTGLIGARVVRAMIARGHDVRVGSRRTGVDAVTGRGLADAFRGADAVVDVTNPPVYEDAAVLDFFVTSTRNQLAAARDAGVGHHVLLSVVGADRHPDSGYLRAKHAQERLVADSGRPFTVVRATQVFEFLRVIADAATEAGVVRLTDAPFQPVAADELAVVLADIVVAPPRNDVVEVGGPEALPLHELVRRVLRHDRDPRTVVADREVRYFGALVTGGSLLPGSGARTGALTLDEWLSRNSDQARP